MAWSEIDEATRTCPNRIVGSNLSPSARACAEPALRARPTPLRSADFGLLGAEPLHSDLPSEGKNVLSEAAFL
jgi:hypothetical protein